MRSSSFESVMMGLIEELSRCPISPFLSGDTGTMLRNIVDQNIDDFKHPIFLNDIITKLRDRKYTSLEEVDDDVNCIQEICYQVSENREKYSDNIFEQNILFHFEHVGQYIYEKFQKLHEKYFPNIQEVISNYQKSISITMANLPHVLEGRLAFENTSELVIRVPINYQPQITRNLPLVKRNSSNYPKSYKNPFDFEIYEEIILPEPSKPEIEQSIKQIEHAVKEKPLQRQNSSTVTREYQRVATKAPRQSRQPSAQISRQSSTSIEINNSIPQRQSPKILGKGPISGKGHISGKGAISGKGPISGKIPMNSKQNVPQRATTSKKPAKIQSAPKPQTTQIHTQSIKPEPIAPKCSTVVEIPFSNKIDTISLVGLNLGPFRNQPPNRPPSSDDSDDDDDDDDLMNDIVPTAAPIPKTIEMLIHESDSYVSPAEEEDVEIQIAPTPTHPVGRPKTKAVVKQEISDYSDSSDERLYDPPPRPKPGRPPKSSKPAIRQKRKKEYIEKEWEDPNEDWDDETRRQQTIRFLSCVMAVPDNLKLPIARELGEFLLKNHLIESMSEPAVVMEVLSTKDLMKLVFMLRELYLRYDLQDYDHVKLIDQAK